VDRTHVSTWMYLNPKFSGKYIPVNWYVKDEQNRPDIEVTLDTPEDLELIRWLFEVGKECRIDLTCQEVIHLIDTYPERYNKVANVMRKNYFEELKAYYSSIPKGAKKK
jgi:spore coat polysaccharide biosynthesis protein SpsF (cytidylyltransferase family)